MCRFTGYSGGFICFCDYIHQGIYGNLWTTCSKRKVPRSHSPFWQKKNARENPACKDTRASAQGGVCHWRSAGNHWNFQLFQCYVASQPGGVFSFFCFFPFYFFLAGKFYFENTTLLLNKKTFFRAHDCFRSYPSSRQIFCPTDSPGAAPTSPLIRHFALSEKLVLGEV